MNNLLIPDKIKVGFQERNNTYTGKLAYVIYYDKKGVLRKERSWNSWRNKNIDSVDYDNIPTSGFVLNKDVGGYKSHWNFRQSYIRIYDPRDFEFEISVENLLFILQECDCVKGKGLTGEFVYAWDGTTLVLLPTNTESYKESTKFTNLQTKQVYKKDLIPGHSYQTKYLEEFLYIGNRYVKRGLDRITQTTNGYIKYGKQQSNNVDVFYNYKTKQFRVLDIKSLAIKISETFPNDYAEIVDAFESGPHRQDLKEIILIDDDDKDEDQTPFAAFSIYGNFYCGRYSHYYSDYANKISIENNNIKSEISEVYRLESQYKDKRLAVKLANGLIVKLGYYGEIIYDR